MASTDPTTYETGQPVEKGDRVRHKTRGTGAVQELSDNFGWAIVKFGKTPPVIVPTRQLTLLKRRSDPKKELPSCL